MAIDECHHTFAFIRIGVRAFHRGGANSMRPVVNVGWLLHARLAGEIRAAEPGFTSSGRSGLGLGSSSARHVSVYRVRLGEWTGSFERHWGRTQPLRRALSWGCLCCAISERHRHLSRHGPRPAAAC